MAVSAFLGFIVIEFGISVFSFSNDPTRTAKYVDPTGKISLSLELFHMHLHLADYERELILSQNNKEVNRQRLFPDTGGYASTNLYKCEADHILVKDFSDSWIVNLDDSSIVSGDCPTEKKAFIGAFRGAGSESWEFFPASERKEELLEAKGG